MTIQDDDPFARLGPVFAGRRALLLEDDPALADHVAERLTAAGFDAVDRFDAGEAALEAAGRAPYDILILDRLTAGMDGLEMLKRLRAGGGTSSDAPALMLTALGGERQKVEGLLGGADDYLAKPVGDEELVARIAAERGQHQGGRVGGRAAPGAQPPEHFQPVHPGGQPVEDQDVVGGASSRFQGRLARVEPVDGLEARGGQPLGDMIGQGRIVLKQQGAAAREHRAEPGEGIVVLDRHVPVHA